MRASVARRIRSGGQLQDVRPTGAHNLALDLDPDLEVDYFRTKLVEKFSSLPFAFGNSMP